MEEKRCIIIKRPFYKHQTSKEEGDPYNETSIHGHILEYTVVEEDW